MNSANDRDMRRTAQGRGAEWTIKGGRVLGPAPFLVMGIVNVTPDSFSDGGANFDPAHAAASATRHLAGGAAMVDVGGESTRPFSEPVSEEEELRRVLPVVRRIVEEHPDAVVSVDTYKARVAGEALAAGASVVNDVSACCSFDPELLEVVAHHKPGYVLMHSCGRPRDMQKSPSYGSVLADVMRFFEVGMAKLVGVGLPEDRIVLDPGIGFGKTLEHNLALISGLSAFLAFGRPVLMGLSNKSLFGQLLGLDVSSRTGATQVATALAFERGAWVHRVHDSAAAVAALTLAQAVGK